MNSSNSRYFTSLDVTAIDNGATVSLDEAGELGNIQLALESKKTIISSVGVLAASVIYRYPSLIAHISYVVGSELRILSTGTPKPGGGTWTVITKDMSTQSDIISVEGLSDIISSGTASKEDIERIFGTSDFDELSAKLSGKIIIDQKTTYAYPYIASVFGGSTLGVITIAMAGIKSTAPNYRPYIGIAYAVGSFSKCSIGKVVTIEDAPSDNTAYERQDGKWVKRSYYTDGNLGLIKSTGDYDKLDSALGDHDLFMNAVASGLRIFSNDFSASDGVYKTNTEIMYQKRDDLNLLELSWIINGIMTIMAVDVSDDWGDILEFKQTDLNSIDQTKLFQVRIESVTNFHNLGIISSDNVFTVKLDKPLPKDYHLVLMRRKKVKYKSTLNREERKKGIRYCLVVGAGGYIGGAYRGRADFLRNMQFEYDSRQGFYILKKKTGENISAFEFAKHYTEFDSEDDVLRVSAAGGCKSLEKLSAVNKNKMIKIQFAVAVIKYRGKNQDSGYVVNSNLAKIDFGFSNNDRGNEIDISTEEGLYDGFQVFVRN